MQLPETDGIPDKRLAVSAQSCSQAFTYRHWEILYPTACDHAPWPVDDGCSQHSSRRLTEVKGYSSNVEVLGLMAFLRAHMIRNSSRFFATVCGFSARGDSMLDILVDADACPVKQEVYRVAKRYGLTVVLVANSWMRTPDASWLKQVVLSDQTTDADDWIVEHVMPEDVVVTADIPLAARCLEKGARAINPRGRVYDENSIGEGLATRELLSYLREVGEPTGGPRPLTKRDRSLFLHRLDEVVQAIRREAAR
jgi:uncharacterized protein YaiI (UPF0178 family)